MEIWAKIFEIDGKQVLVARDISEETGAPQVTFSWFEDDFKVDSSIGWKSDNEESFDNCRKFFDGVTEDIVKSVIDALRNKINGGNYA